MFTQNFIITIILRWSWLLIALFPGNSYCKPTTKPIKDTNPLSILSLITSEPSCAGSATYTNYAPQVTVYVTVDGDYTVTITDNGTISLPTILYTPPPLCSFTVIYTTDSSTSATPLLSPASPPQSLASSPVSLASPPQSLASPSLASPPPSLALPPQSLASIASLPTVTAPTVSLLSSAVGPRPPYTNSSILTSSSASVGGPVPHHPVPQIHSSVPEIFSQSFVPLQSTPSPPAVTTPQYVATTTITVTKKTPVPVSSTTSSQPVVQFPGSGGTTNSAPPVGFPASLTDEGNNSAGSSTTAPADAGNSQRPSNNELLATTINSPGFLPTTINIPGSSNSNVPSSNGGQGPTSAGGVIFNSPFTSVAVSTSFGAASPTVTLVNGVPVQVGSSSVYVGGSYVPLPEASSSSLVTINGETFTINPTEVIGASTTLAIHRDESVSYSPVQAATLPYSTITQNGVIVTVEPTAAVISGKTYTIGLNAQPTVLTFGSQTITLNSAGVIFPSTTYSPAMTTQSAYMVTTVGQLVFSVDQSEAIVSGTTFRIGGGASSSRTTTVIQGTTVVFGPSGVILPSTTIVPTDVPGTSGGQTSRMSASGATKAIGSSSAAAATDSQNAGSTIQKSMTVHISSTLLSVSAFLVCSMLPLSILL